jgi:hypothetical protein
MSLFMLDVEADGSAPGINSMISFAVMKVQRDTANAPFFYGKTSPLKYSEVARDDNMGLVLAGHTRAEHEAFPSWKETIVQFSDWIKENNEGNRAICISDNPAFDWQWINYYCARRGIENPFGHSARRVGDFYAGLEGDFGKASQWKRFRFTKHSHNPVDDVRGNVEALVRIVDMHDVRIQGISRKPQREGDNPCGEIKLTDLDVAKLHKT